MLSELQRMRLVCWTLLGVQSAGFADTKAMTAQEAAPSGMVPQRAPATDQDACPAPSHRLPPSCQAPRSVQALQEGQKGSG